MFGISLGVFFSPLLFAQEPGANPDPLICVPASSFVPHPHAPIPQAIPNTGLPRNIYEGPTPPNWDPQKPVLLFVQGLHEHAGKWWSETVYHGRNDFLDAAYAAGYKTFFVDLWDAIGGPAGTSIDNGCLLRQQIEIIVQYWGAERIHIIAHSKGGLDSTYASILLGANQWVKTVVTLSTPHWGSPLADLAQTAWFGWLSEILHYNDPGTQFLQTANCALYREFADALPGNEALRFYTFAGTSWGPALSGLSVGGSFIFTSCGQNDGLVCRSSAHHPWSYNDEGISDGHHRLVFDDQEPDLHELDHDSIRMGHPFINFLGGQNDCYVQVAEEALHYISILWEDGAAGATFGPPRNPAREPISLRGDFLFRGGKIPNQGIHALTFPMESNVEKIECEVLASDSSLSFQLLDPFGNVFPLEKSEAGLHPIFQNIVPNRLEINQPYPGSWTLLSTGNPEQAFAMILRFQSPVQIDLSLPAGQIYHAGTPIEILPQNRNEQNLIAEKEIEFSLESKTQQSHSERIERKWQGLRTESLSISEPRGIHTLSMTAKGKDLQGFAFERNYVTSIANGSGNFPTDCSQVFSDIPFPPENVRATDGDMGSITISWSHSAQGGPIAGYRLYRRSNNLQCFAQPIATLSAYSTWYEDASISPGPKFYYSLRSFGPGGNSECSNVDSGYYLLPPDPPEDLQASDLNFEDRIRVRWSLPSSSTPITDLTLYRSTESEGCATVIRDHIQTNTQYWDDFMVLPGEVYYYSMRANSHIGPSECSEIETGSAGYLYAAPNLSATDGTHPDKIRVSWSLPASSAQPNYYKLYRSTINNSCATVYQEQIPGNVFSFDDYSVAPNQLYYYSIRSFGAEDSSPCSSNNSGFAAGYPAPLAPINLLASQTLVGKIRIQWNLSSNSSPVTNLQLFRSASSNACSQVLIPQIPGTANQWEDMNVTPGASYYYSLKASGPGGISSCSSVVLGRAAFEAPQTPAQFTATHGSFPLWVHMTWSPPSNGGPISNYQIYRSTSNNPCSNLITTLSSSSTGYADFYALPGVVYYYSIRSVGPGGNSACSPTRLGYRPGGIAPNAPTNVQASDFTFPNKIRVTWTAPVGGGIVTSYKLYRSTNNNPCSQAIVIGIPADLTQFNDTGVEPGHSYCYSLKAVGPGGESACSSINWGYTSP